LAAGLEGAEIEEAAVAQVVSAQELLLPLSQVLLIR
jgi:hypothetical protein